MLLLIFSFRYTMPRKVPEFTITPSVTTVSEDDPSVEVCISSNTVFARDVAVTAETGPKSGALNQATGKPIYTHMEITTIILDLSLPCNYVM